VNADQQPLRKIFNEAVEIADAQQRADYLAAVCGADTALRQSIEELIEGGATDAGRPYSVMELVRMLANNLTARIMFYEFLE